MKMLFLKSFAVIALLLTMSSTLAAKKHNYAEALPLADKKCTPRAICFKDSDCGDDKKARCRGSFVGTCNCQVCISGTPCDDDSACGGLKGACDQYTGLCDCIQGYKANGYITFGHALQKLCNKKTCDVDTAASTCHGLPCRSGRCQCD